MKKFVSIALTLSMVFALAIPTFAATTAELNTEIDRLAGLAGASAADVVSAKTAVGNIASATLANINVAAVKAAASNYKADAKAGTMTADKLKNMESDINKALPSGINISLSSINLDGKKMSANVGVKIDSTVSKTGQTIETVVKVSTKDAPATPSAPAASNPIKTTGSAVDMTNVIAIGLVIASILGVAVVCTRKLGESC